MFEALLILYIVFNIIALFILLICCICTLIANARINKLVTAKVALPTFTECKSTFIKCCVTSSLFLILDWIMFSSSYISKDKISGSIILSEISLKIAFVWAISLALVSLIEVFTKFIKNREYQMKDAINSIIVRTIWCFILTFIIA